MNLIELERALRQLRLGGIAAVLETRLRQAQAEAMAPVDLISCLVSDELTRRSERLLERRRKQAAFRDPQRTLDNFDFTFNPKMNRSLVFDLGRATLDGWVMRVGELLIPVAAVIRRELLGGSYIQADEIPVDVQLRDGRGQNHQAYLWQYSRPGGGVVFDFRLGRGREGPKEFLGLFEGILQTDGYAAYESVGGSKLVHAGCWSHSRRKFFDAVKLNPDDAVSTRIVKRIDELFGVDALARAEKFDHAARQELRLERAQPVVEIIRGEVEAARDASLPSSALGKAANYTLLQWQKLTRFLEHAELELSNNLAENSMRPVALGRKNWIHVGSQQAGPKVAAILSIVETCRRLKIPVRDYLAAVLPGIADVSIQCLADLTPAGWAARQQ